MRFSIIVPVYNILEYINQCVDSLIKQIDYSDYEVILVDDGSSDGSGDVCEQYAQKYNNVKCFHKENGGLSDARNYGISVSNGDYLIFVDGDDYISNSSLWELSKCLESKPDVIVTRLVDSYPEKNILRDESMIKYVGKELSKIDVVKWVMEKSFNTWPAQKFIVSRNFIINAKLEFKKNFFHEDVDWTSKLFLSAEKFAFFCGAWYYHRKVRMGSIMNVVKPKRITDVIKIASDYLVYISENKNFNPDVAECITNRMIRSVYSSINLCKKITNDDRAYVADVINQNRNVFKIAPNLKFKIFSVCLNVIGARKSLKLLSII